MQEILITSSVLILALLVLRLVFAKKVRRRLIYGAWALVALRLLVPVQIGQLDFSVLTAAKPVIEAVDERVEDAILGTTPEAAYRDQVEHYIEKDQTVFVPEVQAQIQQELAQGNQTPGQIYDKIQQQYPEQEILTEKGQELVNGAAGFQVSDTLHAFEVTMLRIWLAGIAVMAIWFAVVNLRHSRMLRQGRKALHCNSILPVYVSEKVGSPCLVGLFHPAVYLTPESAASEETMRHVLTHELTHFAHKDHIWSLVRCVCLCVYWLDPLVWAAAWFSRRDCELACDEGALERLGEDERIAYGKTLLEVVSHAAAHAHLLQTATAMNETKKQLKERVNFIVKKPKLSIIAAVCMVLVCAIVTGCVAAGPAASTSPELPELEPDKSPLPSYDTLLQIAEGMSLKEVTAIAGAPQRMAKHRIPWSPDASGLARVGWVHVFDSQEGKSVGVAFVLKEGEEDYVAEYVFPDFQDTEEKYTVTVESGEQWLYGPLDEYYIFGETGFLMLRNEPGVEYRVFANGKQLEKVKSLTEESFVSYQFMVGQENVVITVEAQVDQALLEIRQAAVKRFSTASDTCKPEEVKLTIISQFGDTYALFVDMPFWMYTQALWTDTVNGLKFNYVDGQRMYIYADGEFYTFRVAFDEKIITADQLTTIWEDYYEKYPNRKDWFEDPTESPQPTQPEAATKWVYLIETVSSGYLDSDTWTTTTYQYDEAGSPTGYSKPGHQCTLLFDRQARTLKTLTEEGSLLFEYTYDEAGRLLTLTYYGSYEEVNKAYTYDGDLLVNEMYLTYRQENAFTYELWEIQEIRYAYDEEGRLLSEHTYRYTPDMPESMMEQCLKAYVLRYYGEDGRPSRTEKYSGRGELLNYNEYSYDDENRIEMTKVYDQRGSGENIRWEVDTVYITTYDENGNVIRREEQEYAWGEVQSAKATTYTYIRLEVPEDYWCPEL